MTVGQLSRRTGVSIKNLRHYTDVGLINSLGRSSTNYRLYNDEALWCVRWIETLRGLGLTIAEISQITELGDNQWFGPWLAERLHESRARLEARIAELNRVRERIDAFEAAHSRELSGDSESLWANGPADETELSENRPKFSAVSA
ncbi:MerR family transcriptional regulator [Stackebrandtia nassauensis]|uniref:Transcriptional regulator, MerR family n=1 Tax=Stackebrandtia nassauensis (strain DSM 44728 / CIP 108903 / NRRL B-16338 / NBRC 102104 / LLR-40K-21) TaxID=446470 RepID=D3PUY1_STANL|nr:MerR family transcriptional regulator [Stackebrandtia nassauensis]ADD45005.1 transcriptional regulator, MerR family [Stackebrandtia nassauensis DSM 44728]